jgi:hypothetical protein
MKVLAFALLAALGVGCTSGPGTMGDPGGTDDAGGSGGPGGSGGSGDPGGGAPPLPRVKVVTGAPPVLIAFREEASAGWKTPVRGDDGAYAFEVSGPYRVVVVCRDTGDAVGGYARTPADALVIDHPCGSRDFPLRVRGQMLESGSVFFGGSGRGQSRAPWTFELKAAAGTYDFIAAFGSLTTGADRIAIRRDVAITGDLDLGTIDAAHEDTHAMVATRFTASNLDPDEVLMSTTFWQMGNTNAIKLLFNHPDQAWQIPLVPGDVLRTSDRQFVELSADLSPSDSPQQRFRSVVRDVRAGEPMEVTMPAPLGATTFETTDDRLTASSASLPAYDGLDLWRESFSSDFSRFVTHDFWISRSFVEATGATSSVLDFSDVPGFRPAWRHDPALEQQVGLYAFHGPDDGDQEVSGLFLDIPAPVTDPGGGLQRAATGRAAAPADSSRARREHERAARARLGKR